MTPFSKLKPTPVVAGRTLRFIIASNAPQSAPLPTFVLSPITMSHDARPTANHANHANDEAVLPPFPNVPSLKRTAGTLDDMTNKMMKDDVVEMQGNDRVSDTHHQPPPEKRMRTNASNKVDDVSPLAATEMQPRARPRKSPLPSRVPAAAAVVAQTAQPSSPAIIAAPIEKYVSSSVNVSPDEHAHSSPWLPSTLPPPPPPLATMDGVRRRMGFVALQGCVPAADGKVGCADQRSCRG